MAKNNPGANGTSSVAKPTAKEIRERYEQEKLDSIKKNFAQAMDISKRFRDPNKVSTRLINAYTRESIRGYLQNPANNEVNLRNTSRYLYYRTQIYFRLIQWYATMWDLRCRQVIPPYDITGKSNNDNILDIYAKTLNQLDIYNMQGNWYDIAVKCYTEDVCYALFFKDDTGSVFYILDPDECKITGKYMTGDFSFAINMSKFQSTQKQMLIEWLGEPLASMYNEYKSSGLNYIEVPPEYAACFKFRSSEWDLIIPPMATLFQELAALMNTADYQAIADEQSIYKLVTLPMKTLQGAKMADDFEFSPELMYDYFKKMVDNSLPDYASSAMVPGEGLKVIDFSTTSADKDVDRYEQSQNTILSTAGGGAVLNTANISSTIAFKTWLKSETEFAISGLLPQVEGWVNRQLSQDLGNNACKVKYFEVSAYTKEELSEQLLTAAQYSFSTRLAYLTTVGISEKDALALEYLETNTLNLNTKMNHPLQSSYTTAGTQGDTTTGRPQVPDDEISDSGERSRNA